MGGCVGACVGACVRSYELKSLRRTCSASGDPSPCATIEGCARRAQGLVLKYAARLSRVACSKCAPSVLQVGRRRSHGCRLAGMRLQARSLVVAGSQAYGCRLACMRLQARVHVVAGCRARLLEVGRHALLEPGQLGDPEQHSGLPHLVRVRVRVRVRQWSPTPARREARRLKPGHALTLSAAPQPPVAI